MSSCSNVRASLLSFEVLQKIWFFFSFARNDLYTLASLEEKAMTDLQLCHKELQENIAVLKVFMGSRFANKIIRTARVTFTGQLASLGTNMKFEEQTTAMFFKYSVHCRWSRGTLHRNEHYQPL